MDNFRMDYKIDNLIDNNVKGGISLDLNSVNNIKNQDILEGNEINKRKKFKIFAAGDIHGDSSLAKKLAIKAKGSDLVILCGDLTYFDSPVEGIIAPFKEQGLRVMIIPGNHEGVVTTEALAQYYEVKNLHGYSVKYDDIGIFGAGGSCVVGPSPLILEDDMFSLLQQGFEKIKYLPKKIMVTHEHPKGSNIEKFTSFFPGSAVISKAINEFKPDFLLCSHVHEAEGIEEKINNTKVINVGKEGKFIEF
jgi:uncharacterized protein